jgi:hypothetical protein
MNFRTRPDPWVDLTSGQFCATWRLLKAIHSEPCDRTHIALWKFALKKARNRYFIIFASRFRSSPEMTSTFDSSTHASMTYPLILLNAFIHLKVRPLFRHRPIDIQLENSHLDIFHET